MKGRPTTQEKMMSGREILIVKSAFSWGSTRVPGPADRLGGYWMAVLTGPTFLLSSSQRAAVYRPYGITATRFLHPGLISSTPSGMSAFSYPQIRVAILGPPNAGKSTLFNRLLDKEANRTYRLNMDKKQQQRRLSKKKKPTSSDQTSSTAAASPRRGHRRHSSLQSGRLGGGSSMQAAGSALVSALPGTTRDRREGWGRIGGTHFGLIDTAGVDGIRLDQWQKKQKQLQQQAPPPPPPPQQQQQLAPAQSLSHFYFDDNDDEFSALPPPPKADPATFEAHLQQAMVAQTLQAALQADLILLMFDARAGVTHDLLEIARWLRTATRSPRTLATESAARTARHRPPPRVLVLANKLEGDHWNYEGSPVWDHLNEAMRIGFGEAVPISAEHGEGMADIAVAIEELLQEKRLELEGTTAEAVHPPKGSPGPEKPLQLAILGRQNVGKSTLVNALLQEERVIAGAQPGLTRDAILIHWQWHGRPVHLVDTAGIRKRSQRDHSDDLEDMAVQDALRAMKVADVAVLVLDASARMLQRQELAIADAVLKEGRAIVVVANKMDLILEEDYSKDDFVQGVREQLEGRFPMLRQTPIVAMSSLTGEAVHELMPVVFRARDRWARTIPTGPLNRWLSEVVRERSSPPVAGRPVRLKYMIQTKGRPPTFLLFCNVDELPESYLRYLTRNFQESFEMFGMEVRLAVKKSSEANPFETKKRGGSGLGGRNARKRRTIARLKSTGVPKEKRRRSRRFG